jgi:hypothetical protein
MNILKHGGKVLSVGLMALSMSAGFSGLAFAQAPAIVVTPNPVVLDNSSAAPGPSYDSFSVTVVGTGLTPGVTYYVTDDFSCTVDGFVGQAEIANNNQRVAFTANETGCTAGVGPNTVKLRAGSPTGSIVASASVTVLDPESDPPAQLGGTVPATTEAAPTTTEPLHHHDTDDDWFAGLLRDALD